MCVSIRISDRALESMVLSASESFVLGDGARPSRRRKGPPSVETYGFVYGFRRLLYNGEVEHVYVDRFYESLSAQRKIDSVKPQDDAVWLKNSIIERWSPHLTLLGDFHTHPYESREDVEKANGWEFSDQDIEAFRNDKGLWKLTKNRPIMFVMAVAPIMRVHSTEAEWKSDGTWVFNVGNLRFWLTAGVGYSKKKKRRLLKRKDITVELDPRFYNETGARLDGVG